MPVLAAEDGWVSPPPSSWEKPTANQQWQSLLEDLIQAKINKEAYQASVDDLRVEIEDRQSDLNREGRSLWRAEDEYDHLEAKLKISQKLCSLLRGLSPFPAIIIFTATKLYSAWS